MYEAQIHLQQKKSCVLAQIANEFGSPLDLHIEELHDQKVTFVINAGADIDEYHDRLSDAEEVFRVERLDSENLGVTKKSCGAYTAIYENHAILRRKNRISDQDRVYNLLFFERKDLKNIIAEFRNIGEVTLSKLTEVGSNPTNLTKRQREVIEAALKVGYFQWPRQMSSEELAEELGISRATCLEHLRKAEEKILREVLQDDIEQSFSEMPQSSIRRSSEQWV